MPIVRSASIPAAFSMERSQPTCRSCSQPSSSWLSTCRRLGRSASLSPSATSLKQQRLQRSELVGWIVLWRENYHHAISDFCNKICQERTSHIDNIARLRETTLRRSPCGTPPIGVRTLTPHQRPCG